MQQELQDSTLSNHWTAITDEIYNNDKNESGDIADSMGEIWVIEKGFMEKGVSEPGPERLKRILQEKFKGTMFMAKEHRQEVKVMEGGLTIGSLKKL